MRILALDWGTVRIGAAVSDPDAKIAFALAAPFKKTGALAEIKKLCDELKVGKIIVGLPLALSGETTASARAANKFLKDVEKATGLAAETVDERFSSVFAEEKLNEAGLDAKQQREIKDNTAAQIMLQGYLDHHKQN
jgi:putative Holliday junction resolvase